MCQLWPWGWIIHLERQNEREAEGGKDGENDWDHLRTLEGLDLWKRLIARKRNSHASSCETQNIVSSCRRHLHEEVRERGEHSSKSKVGVSIQDLLHDAGFMWATASCLYIFFSLYKFCTSESCFSSSEDSVSLFLCFIWGPGMSVRRMREGWKRTPTWCLHHFLILPWPTCFWKSWSWRNHIAWAQRWDYLHRLFFFFTQALH